MVAYFIQIFVAAGTVVDCGGWHFRFAKSSCHASIAQQPIAAILGRVLRSETLNNGIHSSFRSNWLSSDNHLDIDCAITAGPIPVSNLENPPGDVHV